MCTKTHNYQQSKNNNNVGISIDKKTMYTKNCMMSTNFKKSNKLKWFYFLFKYNFFFFAFYKMDHDKYHYINKNI